MIGTGAIQISPIVTGAYQCVMILIYYTYLGIRFHSEQRTGLSTTINITSTIRIFLVKLFS